MVLCWKHTGCSDRAMSSSVCWWCHCKVNWYIHGNLELFPTDGCEEENRTLVCIELTNYSLSLLSFKTSMSCQLYYGTLWTVTWDFSEKTYGNLSSKTEKWGFQILFRLWPKTCLAEGEFSCNSNHSSISSVFTVYQVLCSLILAAQWNRF